MEEVHQYCKKLFSYFVDETNYSDESAKLLKYFESAEEEGILDINFGSFRETWLGFLTKSNNMTGFDTLKKTHFQCVCKPFLTFGFESMSELDESYESIDDFEELFYEDNQDIDSEMTEKWISSMDVGFQRMNMCFINLSDALGTHYRKIGNDTNAIVPLIKNQMSEIFRQTKSIHEAFCISQKFHNNYFLKFCSSPEFESMFTISWRSSKIQETSREHLIMRDFEIFSSGLTKEKGVSDTLFEIMIVQNIANMFKALGYQLNGEKIMVPTFTKKGHQTGAFKVHDAGIHKSVAYFLGDLHNNQEYLECLLKVKDKNWTALLGECQTGISKYEPNSWQFAAEDGIFDAEHLTFHPYPITDHDNLRPINYFEDQTFADKMTTALPVTKSYDKIFLDQIRHLFKPDNRQEQIKLIYLKMFLQGLIGRLMFPTNKLDNWQVMLFLFGVAGTGKSILLNIAMHIIGLGNYGSVTDVSSEQFSWAQHRNKHLVVAPDVGPRFKLPQQLFSMMVSGTDPVELDIKHHDPVQIARWCIPLLFAGNVFPNWIDNQGDLDRRTIFMRFSQKPDTQHDLYDMVKLEVTGIIVRNAKCYKKLLDKVNATEKKVFAQIVPPQISEWKNVLLKERQPVHRFLNSDYVEFHETVGDCDPEDLENSGFSCRASYFMEKMQHFMKHNQINTNPLPFEAYEGVLLSKGLYITEKTVESFNGTMVQSAKKRKVEKTIFGLGISDEFRS